ncbi:MAG: adenosine deaminase family protein [Opitutales bacterium]
MNPPTQPPSPNARLSSPSTSGLSRRRFLGAGLVSSALAAFTGRAAASVRDPLPAEVSSLREQFPSRTFSGRSSGIVSTGSIAAVYEAIKREGTPADLYRFLYALPKGGDIHHHMGGSMLPQMWWDIATDPSRNGGQTFYTRNKIGDCAQPLPLRGWSGPHTIRWLTIHEALYESLDPCFQEDFKPLAALTAEEQAQWKSAVVLDTVNEGRNEFFEYHWPRLGSLLSDITIVGELMVENMRRYGAEGVRYLEIMTGPWGQRGPDGRTLTPEETDAYFRQRLAQPDALATGVLVRFQTVVLRFADDAVERVPEHFAWLDQHRELWRGVNMAGREDDNRGYPARFTEAFDEALRRTPGIGIAIHAGEAEKPDSYIFDTLRLGANRIGHGCNLIMDTSTMQLMRSGQFLVEINLISNHLLKYVRDPKQHPFPIYLRQGIPCCLNTDDRGMWSSNMTDEYYLAVTHFNLSWDELVKLGRHSLEFAFLTEDERSDRLASFETALENFAESFSGVSWQNRLALVQPETYGYARRYFDLSFPA